MQAVNSTLLALAFSPLLAQVSMAQVETAHIRRGSGDRFGFDLTVRDDVLYVGANCDDDAGSNAGAVYVFHREDGGTPGFLFDDDWVEVQKLIGAEVVAGDFFGHRLDADGDLVAISAIATDGAFSDAGAVYVFQRDRKGTSDPLDDTWRELDKLLPSSSFHQQRFGQYVAIEGGTVAVGVRDDTGPTDEKVFVFERDDNGTPANPWDDSWSETTFLEGGPLRERFGWSLDLSPDTLVIGARWHDLTSGDDNSGGMYVYYRDDRGTPADRGDDLWLEGPFISPDTLVLGGQFGRGVEIFGDTVLVGAWKALGTGAAYLYERDRRGTADPADDLWTEITRLLASDGVNGDEFGNGVALGPDVCSVGAAVRDEPGRANVGKAYVFVRDDRGTPADPFDDTWPEAARLVGSQGTAGAVTANQVSISGDTLAMGASSADFAHLFDLDGALRLDMQTEDDWVTPLVNGQAVSTAAGFGRWLTLEGISSVGLGAATFDSTVPGPNLSGPDPDLLVSTGNLLILQDDPDTSAPGVYVVPDDDALGGTLVVDFLHGVATPLSVNLVDIDAIPDQEVTLTLHDRLGATRTYFVPSGWTEDITVDGPLGYRTLDLTTLAPQPGFLAIATAFESPGFEARSVVRMEVLFEGSAALDELCWSIDGSSPAYGAASLGKTLRSALAPLRRP